MRVYVVVMGIFLFLWPAPIEAVSLDGLSQEEKETLQSIRQQLDPLVRERKSQGTAPLLNFEELYESLSSEEKRFLDEVRVLDPAALSGSSRKLPIPPPKTVFIRLDSQVIWREGKPILIDVQYLPFSAYQSYLAMMAQMEIDLGKRLLVESGYRSPAYQLYLFLFYLPKHDFSIRETNRHVALPGCSEHGAPSRQAIDFITPEGINGEDRPEEFEELQEYGWLHARAHEFGFHLSYPRGGLSAFEPWHWHYEAVPAPARPPGGPGNK